MACVDSGFSACSRAWRGNSDVIMIVGTNSNVAKRLSACPYQPISTSDTKNDMSTTSSCMYMMNATPIDR